MKKRVGWGHPDNEKSTFGPETFAHVSLTAIAEDRYDDRLSRQRARDGQSGDDIGPGADPHEQAFFGRQTTGHRLRFFGGDLNSLIGQSWIKYARHP